MCSLSCFSFYRWIHICVFINIYTYVYTTLFIQLISPSLKFRKDASKPHTHTHTHTHLNLTKSPLLRLNLSRPRSRWIQVRPPLPNRSFHTSFGVPLPPPQPPGHFWVPRKSGEHPRMFLERSSTRDQLQLGRCAVCHVFHFIDEYIYVYL